MDAIRNFKAGAIGTCFKYFFYSKSILTKGVYSSILLVTLSFWLQNSYGQITTISSGTWSTGSNWSGGAAPGSATTATVNNAMQLDANLNINQGDYTFNSSVTDQTGAATLTVAGSSGNGGTLIVNADSEIDGAATINAYGILTVKSGKTLVLGPTSLNYTIVAFVPLNIQVGKIIVESGATLIVNGDLANNGTITNDGSVIVDGDYTGYGTVDYTTTPGTITTTGTMNSSSILGLTGLVYGQTPFTCNSSPCNAGCVDNTLNSSGNQTICAGSTPATLVGSSGTNYNYQWQISTQSAGTGFVNISSSNGGTLQNLPFGTSGNVSPYPTVNTWYRRIVAVVGCNTATSNSVKVTVTALPTITATTPGSRCNTGTVVLGATPSAGTINWYASAVSTTVLGTGTSFTTPSISTTTTYYSEAVNNTCKSASRTAVTATVNTSAPTVTSTTPGSNCGTGTVILSATASAGATLRWYSVNTGGTILGTGTSFTTPSISATTNYYVEAFNGCTSASRTLVVATINTLPTITGTTPASRCSAGSITLSATASTGTIKWYDASIGGTLLNTGTSYNIASLSATTTYYVDATSAAGCVSSSRTAVTATITTPSPVSVTISANPSGSVCSGNVVFTATPTNGGGSPGYKWYDNGTQIAGQTASTFTAASTTYNGHAITAVLTSNASCVSGNPATSNAITVVQLSTISWDGTSDTDWRTNANWCSGARPTNTNDVSISSGVPNMPTVGSTGTGTCRDLTVNAGATLTVSNTLTVARNLVVASGGNINITSGAVLNVAGNITNSGSISGAGTMTLNGTALQTMSGTGTFGNVTLSNTTTPTGCSVSSAVTISGILTLSNNVVLASGGNLTIDLNSGAIAGTGTGASITGNITVKKDVNSGSFHYLSSPLNNLKVSDFTDNLPINNNYYYYNEPAHATSSQGMAGWTLITNTGTSLNPLQGYALNFNNSTTVDATSTYTHVTTPSLALTCTAPHNLGIDGWNLVGNPYPSTIDWNAASGWTKTNVLNGIYFWDAANFRYVSYVNGVSSPTGTASNLIAPMQGFYVRVDTTKSSGTLGVSNAVRVTSSVPSLWKVAAQNNLLRLKLSSNGYYDETVVRISEQATDFFDGEYDAYKLTNDGNTPSFYSTLNNDIYSINSIPEFDNEKVIPLSMYLPFAGTYTINSPELNSFDNSIACYLEDKTTSQYQDMRTVSNYDFNADAPGGVYNRFYLHMKVQASTAVNDPNTSEGHVKIYSSSSRINMSFNDINSGTANIKVLDNLGREVVNVNDVNISSGYYTMNCPGNEGIYMVKVLTEEKVYTAKVYLGH